MKKMTTGQVFSSVFISASFFAAVLPEVFGEGNAFHTAICILLSCLLNIILYLVLINFGVKTRASSAIKILFLIIFCFASAQDLSSLGKFLRNTIFPMVSVELITLLCAASAVFCALKGFISAARSALIIMVLLLLGELIINLGALSFYRVDNFILPFYEKGNGILSEVISISAKSFFYPILFFKDRYEKSQKIFVFSQISAAVFASLLYLSAGFALGGFGTTQLFPLYTVSGIIEIGVIRRLDIIFGMIFIMAGVFRMILNFCCIAELFENKISPLIVAALVTWLLVFANAEISLLSGLFVSPVFCGILLLSAVLIPFFAKAQGNKRQEVSKP